jgi:opacity protein-like surface antigen
MMRRLAFLLTLASASALSPAFAEDADDAALQLADQAPAEAAKASDWAAFVEAAGGRSTLRSGPQSDNQRLSLDVALDKRLAPAWRVVFADRLDMNWHDEPARQDGVNTLKEAYIGWQARDDLLFDLGRINVRNGVATGYNPTDYFRAGAVRSVVSADPGSLKRNRQGSVMLRAQTLWEGGSLSAMYSPKLADQPNDAALNPNVGATNHQDRWLLSVSQKLSDNINPQWLLYKEERQPVQLGFNLALLANDATVVYAEWSGGRSRSLFSQATAGADDTAFRSRASTGLTYTTPDKLSLTLEYQYNGAGLQDAQWSALPRTSLAAYGSYRTLLQNAQDMPTRNAIFFYASWQDAMINHLDLNAMERYNVADGSRLSWLEARYHWDRYDVALQWQMNSGSIASEFGAATQRRTVQALLRYFF